MSRQRKRRGAAALLAAAIGFGAANAAPDALPERVDLPTPRPAPVEPRETVEPHEAVAAPDPALTGAVAAYALPRSVAVPAQRPATTPPARPGHSRERGAMPPSEVACRARLRALGASFTEARPRTDETGCALPYPIRVERFSPVTAVEPVALLNCATAEAAARFLIEDASPAAKAAFGAPIATVANASAYVCRPRNGTNRLSEHAFGNALDISALVLADGTRIEVRSRGPEEQDVNDFLQEIRGAACGPFKTVLGPGTDADHADHFHFDLAQRRNDGTYCR